MYIDSIGRRLKALQYQSQTHHKHALVTKKQKTTNSNNHGQEIKEKKLERN